MSDIGYFDQSYPPSIWATPPTLTSIAPSTGVINAAVTITATGTNFKPSSVMEVNGAPVPTTFVSATSVTGAVTLPATAGNIPVVIRTDGTATSSRTFVVTATGELQSVDEPPTEYTAVPVEEIPPDTSSS